MTKKLVAALVAAGVVLGVAGTIAATAPFSDTTGHEHEAAIRLANAKGLFAGYEDGTFRPDRTLTNRQSEVVLRRLLDKYTDDDGNSTLTRAEAAVVLIYGVCGLDADCGPPTPPRPRELDACENFPQALEQTRAAWETNLAEIWTGLTVTIRDQSAPVALDGGRGCVGTAGYYIWTPNPAEMGGGKSLDIYHLRLIVCVSATRAKVTVWDLNRRSGSFTEQYEECKLALG